MKKFIIGIGLLILAALHNGMAAEISSVKEEVAYTTQDEAAKAALHEIMSTSDHDAIEYAGIIVQIGNGFFFTCPVTSDELRAFSIRAQLPKGAKFVAIYHTHADHMGDVDKFSPTDVATATSLKVTSYIGITRSMTIRRFNTKTDSVVGYKEAGSAITHGYTSEGTVI